MESCCVIQAGLELLNSRVPLASVSPVAVVADLVLHSQRQSLVFFFFLMFALPPAQNGPPARVQAVVKLN